MTREYYRAYRQKNRERLRQYQAAWEKRNRERRKPTRAAQARNWRAQHPGHDREYRIVNRDRRNEWRRKWAAAHPERIREYNRRHHKSSTSLQGRANSAVYRAIKSGKLLRPSNCSKCGKICKPHGHHHLGYAQEHWLAIIWLCTDCHEAAHHPLRLSLGKQKNPIADKSRH